MIRKYFLSLVGLLLLSLPLLAQDNVFVLVDVSGNPRGLSSENRITPAMRDQAGELVRQLVGGQFNKDRFMQDWRLSGNTDPVIENIVNGGGQPLINQGGYLLIMPFGDKDTYEQFRLNRVNNVPSDVDAAWRMPGRYTDQNTFGEIARAKAADVAIDANLSSYYLVVISGLGEDTNSKNLYTTQEQNYMDNYRSAVRKDALGIFRYRDDRKDYKIEISKIDLTRMRGAGNTAGTKQIIDSTHIDEPILEIVTPKGSRQKPYELKGDKMLVSWSCVGCKKDAEYTVKLLHMEDRGSSQTKKVKGRTNYNFALQNEGPYRVVVSNEGSATSTEYFTYQAEGGGGSFLLWLLILAVLGGIAWFLYKQFIAPKPKVAGVVDNDDDFFSDRKRKKKSRPAQEDDFYDDSNKGSGDSGYF
ncbi:hypothetical protein AB9P05_00285 [Roseivirga sp. BDSF3-8]|uniref:hypothetical protein n=1 Tax=Roseivirga sp. BDSF3-8 TaxID=3241598 RepID=UPI00353185A9